MHIFINYLEQITNNQQINFYITLSCLLNLLIFIIITMQQYQQISLQQSKSYNLPRPSSRTAVQPNKQSFTLDKLKKQNQYLKGIISRLGDKQKQPTRSRPNTAINKSNINSILKQLIQAEKTELKKLDEDILALKKQTWSKKTPEVGVMMEKQLKVLEARLDKGTHKLNETLAQIQDQKKLIDKLRREKGVFQTLYHKLEKELNEKRKQMANIIEKANQSYEERDKMTANINSIKQQARRETFDFEKQLKQLSLLTEKSKIGQYSVSTRRPLSSQETIERPKTAKKKQNPVNMKRLQKLREDFKKIQGATQISNFSELIKTFLKNQEENYKKFKKLNQKAYQIEALEQQLAQLNKEVKSAQLHENQPDKRMQESKKKLENAEKRQDEVYAQQRLVSDNLSSLLNYVDKMYYYLFKKDRDETVISETNVMMFLEKIEQKATLIQKLRRELGTVEAQKSPKSQTAKSPKKETAFMFDNYLDDDEEYDKILTHEDFMKKASERFASKSKDTKQQSRHKK